MTKPGRPLKVELKEGDRERARDNLERIRRTWRLSAGDLAILLETTAGVVSAIRNTRPVASSNMIARALALDDANVAISALITRRKVQAEKLAHHLETARAYNDAMNSGRGWPPADPAAPKPAAPDKTINPDPDIPFT